MDVAKVKQTMARRFPLLLRAPPSSPTQQQAIIKTIASIADAYGIERPGAEPFLSSPDPRRGIGLAAVAAGVRVCARVPLSLALSCDASLVSLGACGPPPAEFLPSEGVRRLLPEGGCGPEDDASVGWELRLGALQLWAAASLPAPPLPEQHARCRALWSRWRESGALPVAAPALLCWSARELDALGDGALAAAAAAWRADARDSFEAHGLGALAGLAGGGGRRRATLDDYLWAVSAVASRAFALEQEEDEEDEEEEGGQQGAGAGACAGAGGAAVVGRAAVPWIDLANHGAEPSCRVRLRRARGGGGGAGPVGVELVLLSAEGQKGAAVAAATAATASTAAAAAAAGAGAPAATGPTPKELMISYGADKPSRVLMERYGFFPESGAASDRVDWRELVAPAPGGAGGAGEAREARDAGGRAGLAVAGPARGDRAAAASSAAAAVPPLGRDALRRAVLLSGGLDGNDAGLTTPLSRAALAAAEARVQAAIGAPRGEGTTAGGRGAEEGSPFGPAHAARASRSAARLLGWRGADEYRRSRAPGASDGARAAGAALAAAAAEATRRGESGPGGAAAAAGGEELGQADPRRLALAAAYRAERGRLLLALRALGEALAKGR